MFFSFERLVAPSSSRRSVVWDQIRRLNYLLRADVMRVDVKNKGAFPELFIAGGGFVKLVLRTSKKFPKTSFIARNAAAIPPVRARNFRREIPSRRLLVPAISISRFSTRFCSGVWSGGANSSFDTICVGIGSRSSSMSHF